MNPVKAIIGTAILTTAGIIAGGVATGKFNENHPQTSFPVQNNECILVDKLEVDKFIKQQVTRLSKNLKK